MRGCGIRGGGWGSVLEEHVEEHCCGKEDKGEDHNAREVCVALRLHQLADAAAELGVLLAQVLQLALRHPPPHRPRALSAGAAAGAAAGLCRAPALCTRDHCRTAAGAAPGGAQLRLDLEQSAHLCCQLCETRLGAAAPLGERRIVPTRRGNKFTHRRVQRECCDGDGGMDENAETTDDKADAGRQVDGRGQKRRVSFVDC